MFSCKHPGENGRRLGTVEILDVVENATSLFPFILEHAGSTYDWNASPEKTLNHAMDFPTLVIDTVERAQAGGTNFLLCESEPPLTHAAITGKEEIEKRGEEIHNEE